MNFEQWAEENIKEYFGVLSGRPMEYPNPIKVDIEKCDVNFRTGRVNCQVSIEGKTSSRWDFSLEDLNDPQSAAERDYERMMQEEGKIDL